MIDKATQLMCERSDKSEEKPSELNEEFFVRIIEKWQFNWMDVKGTDERDRENYYRRAHMIDANMRYSLARMIEKAVAESSNHGIRNTPE